jgi:hypothetical protein
MSDEDDRNRADRMQGIVDAMTGRVDYTRGSHYAVGRGAWYMEQNKSGTTSYSGGEPLPLGCSIAMLSPFVLGLVYWLASFVFVMAHDAVIHHCEQSVDRLRPVAVGVRESDLDRMFVYHPFSTYAAYTPGYEQYMGVVTNGNGWNSPLNISDREFREQRTFIQSVRRHGENSPEFVALTAAAWKLCVENRCSFSRLGLGLHFLHWLATDKHVPEAQFDLTVRSSNWATGRSLLTNARILELSELWRNTAARYPDNPLIADMEQRIDPERHGRIGAEYIRLLQFQDWLVKNYDIAPVTRR